jgi:hypothetical protein
VAAEGRDQFRRAADRVVPVVDAALAEFVTIYNLRPATRDDAPPRVVWSIEDEPIVEFVHRDTGTSEVVVHDIGLLGTLKKQLRSRRVRVEHALQEPH